MTTRSDKSPVTRETTAYVRDKGLRAVIVTVTGSLIELRPKGLRSREVVDVAAIYTLAVRARVQREKAERLAARKARRSR